MQCKSEMKEEIDIEEHNIFDNPRLRKIFPDTVKLKQELDDEVPSIGIESLGFLPTKQEGADEVINGNQPPTATAAGLPNTSKYFDVNITNNDKDFSTFDKTCNQNVNIQLGVQKSRNVIVDVCKEDQIINYTQEFELILKKEIPTCNVCSKESEEEMCKQCVLESAECAPCSPSDRSVLQVVDNTKKEPGITFACDICPYTSLEKTDFEQHLLKHPGEISYKCDYKTSRCVIFKNRVKNKQNTYFCDICEYGCVSRSQLITHFRKHTEEKPYKCNLCDHTSSQGCNLKKHMNAKHTKEKNYSCNVCEYKSVKKTHLNQHLRKHTGEKPYKCDLCDHTSSQGCNLKKHMKAKHSNENNYSCNVCEYKSNTKSHLIEHLQKHTGEKPYKCDFISSQGDSLKSHIEAKYTNEKNYSCNMCEFKSVKKYQLIRHIRKHTGEKPYRCDLCDYTSSKDGNLKRHMKFKHTNEKNYSCNVCEYRSCSKRDLDRHIRKHTGEKPYKCDLCDYTSSTDGNLKRHMKFKHTNEKNYSCNMCEYRFCSKSDLDRHIRRHNGEKPYKCD